MRRVIALSAAALLAGPAVGATAATAPAPCRGGLDMTDPSGDAYYTPGGAASTPMAASSSADLTGAFVNSDGGQVTLNLVVADLDAALGPGGTTTQYWVDYVTGGKGHFVYANLGDATAWFYYGHRDANGSAGEDGSGAGEIFPGPNGVVSFVVRPNAGGLPGEQLTDVQAQSYFIRLAAKVLTDSAKPFAYGGALCPVAPAPAPAGAAAPAPLAAAALPPVTVSTQLRRGRTARLALRSSEALTQVVLTLRRGRRTVGRATLASLPRAAAVRVPLRARRVPRGAYDLLLSGRRSDGSPV